MRGIFFGGLILPVYLLIFLLLPMTSLAGVYIDSTHGDTTAGVDRNSMPSVYGTGNCAHCHEQHMSIGGSEPNPVGGPSDFALFEDGYTSNTDNFCVECHDGSTTIAASAITNHSYSYRAGGLTTDYVFDIQSAFDTTGMTSIHNLTDISTLLSGSIGTPWGFTSKSQPCEGCHNPHAVQGDPENSPNGRKSQATRGYPVSRPSQYSIGWGVWGDTASEKMNNYTANYQAPYRFGTTSAYEPDGSTTQDGSNLADYNTFCTDCHNTTNSIFSTSLGRTLRTIDWANEKHGNGNADASISVDNPYTAGSSSMGYVLACTDCHEPHGSTNAFLIRPEVNGSSLGGTIGSFSTTNWVHLCARCHDDNNQSIHHFSADYPYTPVMCNSCHSAGNPKPKITCSNCHFHGSVVPTTGGWTPRAPTPRTTF